MTYKSFPEVGVVGRTLYPRHGSPLSQALHRSVRANNVRLGPFASSDGYIEGPGKAPWEMGVRDEFGELWERSTPVHV